MPCAMYPCTMNDLHEARSEARAAAAYLRESTRVAQDLSAPAWLARNDQTHYNHACMSLHRLLTNEVEKAASWFRDAWANYRIAMKEG